MYLIELFLPLSDNDNQRFPRSHYEAVEQELTTRFGGITSYPRAPASGLWQSSPGEVQHDDLIVYEVMTETLDDAWWASYRRRVEQTFRQEKLLVRAQQVDLL
jgi:hypothetical protein